MGSSSFDFALRFVTCDRSITQGRFLEIIAQTLPRVENDLGMRAPKSAFTTSLKMQLAWLLSGNYCSFGGCTHSFNYWEILDEVAHLEDRSLPTTTKEASEFAGPLAGGCQKHFFDARYISQNLLQELKQNWGRLWYKHFRERHEAATGQSWVGAPLDEAAINALSYAVVFDALDDRRQENKHGARSRMTGEWIVYAYDDQGRIVFLTLGVHGEKASNLVSIAARIWQASHEFPFVIERLTKNGVIIERVA